MDCRTLHVITRTRSFPRCKRSTATRTSTRSRRSRRSSSTTPSARKPTRKQALEDAKTELALITGQKPAETRAKKSIANFKLRKEQAIGAKVTLRGARMYEFLERLIKTSPPAHPRLPRRLAAAFRRQRQLHPRRADQSIFPEIELDKIKRNIGFDVTIVTTARTNDEAKSLLSELGMPFRRSRPRKPADRRSRLIPTDIESMAIDRSHRRLPHPPAQCERGAARQEIFAPYSKIKAEIARILKEEGYITDYEVDTTDATPAHQGHEQAGQPQPRHHRPQARQQARSAPLRRRRRDPARPRRHRHLHSFHPARRHDRPRSQETKRRRRASRLRLVRSHYHVTNWQKTHRNSRQGHGQRRPGWRRRGRRPEGQARLDPAAEHHRHGRGQPRLRRPRAAETRSVRALHGLSRSLVTNMVNGVSEGFAKDLEIQGVGFQAAVKGQNLNLSLGYSHPLLLPIPNEHQDHRRRKTPRSEVEGIDKQLVGQVAADIRALLPAGALQGQRRPLRRRTDPPQGRQNRPVIYGRSIAKQSVCKHRATPASARKSPAPPSVRASPSTSRASTSTPRSSTTTPARPSPPLPRPRRTSSASPTRGQRRQRASKVGKAIAERALAPEASSKVVFDRGGFTLPRQGESPRRRRPRRRPEVLISMAHSESRQTPRA